VVVVVVVTPFSVTVVVVVVVDIAAGFFWRCGPQFYRASAADVEPAQFTDRSLRLLWKYP
jgi:hypothetical protein